jgi:hypothetical protein
MTDPTDTEIDDTEAPVEDFDPAPSDVVEDDPQPDDEPDTFPRSYVEELRQENGKYRQRAQAGEVYAQRLHTELVRATGRLADPTDLPFDAEHLDDADKLAAAVDDLLARKPHLANRRPMGEIGQGASPSVGTVDLAAILRQRAN